MSYRTMGGTQDRPDQPGQPAQPEHRWTKAVSAYERIVVIALIALLMVVVAAATVELGTVLFADLSTRQTSLLDIEEMFSLFGYFLLVLIGLELLTTLKTYIRKGVFQVEVVLEVALIAVAQKLIILNVSHVAPSYVFGLAALILSLAAAFWLVRAPRR